MCPLRCAHLDLCQVFPALGIYRSRASSFRGDFVQYAGGIYKWLCKSPMLFYIRIEPWFKPWLSKDKFP
ncbi:hypothetical protein BABINDRAFT_116113 [Babjeviella inositovora NRRL Y-12698]|uniref:Uncharacterized protein n=1 Tax=Babjeviella inositovora NRRL Y-12698 TaxID=984486 RepID=A0A1E3QWN9_9ASCO|nr:uncharacterized protein BABINDRAFT_116113 [Babjeviella inositovora NRRL Y-12698]ODQ82109.1 hypothetical protein BABINDRAFT_116113 [Babjeviella inositovora NRRL Y-12698]